MKTQISATIEKENLKWLERQVKIGRFRNVSHGIDTAITTLKSVGVQQ